MTYHDNDPARRAANDPARPAYRDRSYSSTTWVVGALAAIAAIGLIVWALSGDFNVASTDRPATTTEQNTGAAPSDPARRNAPPPATTRTAPPATTPPAKQQ